MTSGLPFLQDGFIPPQRGYPTSEPMSPTPNPVGQDAAVAVLQSKQESLEHGMRDLSRAVNEGFAGINVKMDKIGEISNQIAGMAARQDAHNASIERAFQQIAEVKADGVNTATSLRERIDAHENSIAQQFSDHADFRVSWLERHATDHGSIEKRWSLVRGIAIGALLLTGTLLGLLMWIALDQIGVVRSNTNQIHEIQLDSARIRGK